MSWFISLLAGSGRGDGLFGLFLLQGLAFLGNGLFYLGSWFISLLAGSSRGSLLGLFLCLRGLTLLGGGLFCLGSRFIGLFAGNGGGSKSLDIDFCGFTLTLFDTLDQAHTFAGIQFSQ